MFENITISIIVPIYNSSNYLESCLDSIILQTYSNLEIILIDDGSTDNSLEICQRFSEKDNRIKLFQKQNTGVSDTRNFGLSKVTSKYVTFVDSDDQINPKQIEILIKNLIDTDSDISITNYEKVDFELSSFLDMNNEHIKVYNREDAIKEIVQDTKIRNFVAGKLFKTSLFENVKFPVGKRMEDMGTLYKLFLQSKKIVYSDSVGYYYINRTTGITNNVDSSFVIDLIDIYVERYKILKENFPNMILLKEKIRSILIYYFYSAHHNKNVDIINHIKVKDYYYFLIKEYKNFALLFLNCNVKEKLKLLLIKNTYKY